MTKFELACQKFTAWMGVVLILAIFTLLISSLAKQYQIADALIIPMGVGALMGLCSLAAETISYDKRRVKHPYGVQGVYK
jgi:hypothetical protein